MDPYIVYVYIYVRITFSTTLENEEDRQPTLNDIETESQLLVEQYITLLIHVQQF